MWMYFLSALHIIYLVYYCIYWYRYRIEFCCTIEEVRTIQYDVATRRTAVVLESSREARYVVQYDDVQRVRAVRDGRNIQQYCSVLYSS